MGTHPIFESDFDCLTDMSLKQVVSFAFVGSIALTLLLLSCTLKFNEETNEDFTKNSYGLFVIIFYVLAPLPLVIARNMESESGMEMAVFFSIGFIISSFALPAVLANRDVIEYSVGRMRTNNGRQCG